MMGLHLQMVIVRLQEKAMVCMQKACRYKMYAIQMLEVTAQLAHTGQEGGSRAVPQFNDDNGYVQIPSVSSPHTPEV